MIKDPVIDLLETYCYGGKDVEYRACIRAEIRRIMSYRYCGEFTSAQVDDLILSYRRAKAAEIEDRRKARMRGVKNTLLMLGGSLLCVAGVLCVCCCVIALVDYNEGEVSVLLAIAAALCFIAFKKMGNMIE